MPRLSVDVDLTCLPVADRQSSLEDMDDAFSRIMTAITERNPRVKARRIAGGGDNDARIMVSDGSAQIKIETSPVASGPIPHGAVACCLLLKLLQAQDLIHAPSSPPVYRPTRRPGSGPCRARRQSPSPGPRPRRRAGRREPGRYRPTRRRPAGAFRIGREAIRLLANARMPAAGTQGRSGRGACCDGTAAPMHGEEVWCGVT